MSAQVSALLPEAPRSPPAFNYDPILKIKRAKDGASVAAPAEGLRVSHGAVPSSAPLTSLVRCLLPRRAN